MGAFEDRLAAGYRKAANTPAKMPQPTTPTEALAEALHDYFREPSTKQLDAAGMEHAAAAAILAAQEIARYREMRMMTADEERQTCFGPMGAREFIGAIVDGDNVIYIDQLGNLLEPGWVLRVLRGTDARPLLPLEAEDHPWMKSRKP